MTTAAAPRCARCGTVLPDRGHYLARFHQLPGTPTIAWCADCLPRDVLADRAIIVHLGLPRVLDLIATRGPGRVLTTPTECAA